MTDAQEALRQVREALADPALFDEGASVDDTFRAADNFGAARSPENVAAILAHIDAQAAEIERLQVGIELIETENADLLTRLDLESGTVGMIARECADLRRQLDECSQMLARQAATIGDLTRPAEEA